MSNLPSQTSYHDNPSLETQKKVCGIPARLTGFFSLIIQTLILFFALGLTILMFYEVGGFSIPYKTAPIKIDQENGTFPTPVMLEITNILSDSNETFEVDMMKDPSEWENRTSVESFSTTTTSDCNKTLLQEIGLIYLRIGKVEFEIVSLLHCSCLLYASFCFLWLISIVCLGTSLRYEVLDLIYINTFVLTVALIYTLVQALLVAIIIFYLKAHNKLLLLLIAGIVSGYMICFIFACFAMVFLVVWYRYIDYINGSNETCMCTSTIASLIKNQRHRNRGRQAAAADYSIPEATRHANLPYIDEPTVQQFSNF